MEFVERTDVNEIGVFARHARRVGVFLHELVRAGPFAEASDGLFVRAADGVFEREAAAEHKRTQVIAKIELMAALRQSANETVRAPVLSDRGKVRKPARQILGQILRALLVTPNDVPLGIRKIGVLERPTIFLTDVRCSVSVLRNHGKLPDSGFLEST